MTGPSPFWPQVLAIARRDLARERRAGEVVWITIPFGAVALLLIPLAVGTDENLLRDIGPGMFWVVVLLFGVLTAVRRTGTETPAQRDAVALLGIDPAAEFTGKVLAGGTMLLGFELLVGAVAVALYDVDLGGWPWLFLIMPLAAAGLAELGTLSGSIAASLTAGPALIPFLVAPLAIPLLLGATQSAEAIRQGDSILSWILLMAIVVLALAVAGVLTARPLQETR
jgi:heme exporter protein B